MVLGSNLSDLGFCEECGVFLLKKWWMLLGSNQSDLGFGKGSGAFLLRWMVDATGFEPVTPAL